MSAQLARYGYCTYANERKKQTWHTAFLVIHAGHGTAMAAVLLATVLHVQARPGSCAMHAMPMHMTSSCCMLYFNKLALTKSLDTSVWGSRDDRRMMATSAQLDVPDKPHQPSLNFPKRMFGHKKPVSQSFQASWFTQWPWLHYSEADEFSLLPYVFASYSQE